MTKIAVTGACGRMGRLIIDNILKTESLELVSAIDITNIGKDIGKVLGIGNLYIDVEDANNIDSIFEKSKIDILIDFTISDAATKNIISAAKHGISLVVGTTGFTKEQRELIDSAIKNNNVAAVISPNFSIGVNVFWELISKAAKYLKDYDVEIIEMHHNKKKDAPSGTANRAAEIISKIQNKKNYVYGRYGISPRKDDEIGIHAIRGGDIVGDHIVLFAGKGERIEIKHQAHTREAFAKGAIKAAIWVSKEKPGIYEMKDVLGIK